MFVYFIALLFVGLVVADGEADDVPSTGDESNVVEKNNTNPADTSPPTPFLTLSSYSKRIQSNMQCYTSITDWCEWKRSGYLLDNFDKLRSDEW